MKTAKGAKKLTNTMDVKNDPRRKWIKVCPGETAVPGKLDDFEKAFCNLGDNLGLHLARYICPDEHYAQEAYTCGMEHWKYGGSFPKASHPDKRLDGNVLTDEAKKDIRNQKILQFMFGNLLFKGEGLVDPQIWHVDGWGLNLLAIMVMHCGDSGYQFRAFGRSHNLSELPKFVPNRLTEMLRVDKKKIIVFSERTVHSGGASSGDCTFRPEFQKAGEYLLKRLNGIPGFPGPGSPGGLTDMSLQFTFRYTPKPAADLSGYARQNLVLAPERDGDREDIDVALSLLREAGDRYREERKRGFKQFLEMLRGNKDHGPRKRGAGMLEDAGD